jgi:hypothetical protein
MERMTGGGRVIDLIEVKWGGGFLENHMSYRHSTMFYFPASEQGGPRFKQGGPGPLAPPLATGLCVHDVKVNRARL